MMVELGRASGGRSIPFCHAVAMATKTMRACGHLSMEMVSMGEAEVR